MAISVVAVGDAIVTSRGLGLKIDPLIAEAFEQADVGFANAEFTIPARSTPPAPLDRHYSVLVDDWVLDELTGLGVNVVSLANNHMGDFGWQGVADTLAACRHKGLIATGAGYSLAEARMPAFVETSSGRFGLVSAASSSALDMLASNAGSGVAARPGTNPLRVSKKYHLAQEDFRMIRDLDERLGTAATRRHRDNLGFVGGFEKHVVNQSFGFGESTIVLGESSELVASVDEADLNDVCAAVEDAARRCDVVTVSLHCHEGINDGWNTDTPAPFVEYSARRLIDAGARAIFGHGPHMLRGIEVYHGCPIFYSLGNFVFEFEMIDRVPPEMYRRYGLPENSTPSELHHLIRARDKFGNWQGFYADPVFWTGCLAQCEFGETGTTVNLAMLSLGFQEERAVRRGVPRRTSAAESARAVDKLRELSKPYGTDINFDPTANLARVTC